MPLELRYDPDPILAQVCVPVAEVDDDIRELVRGMVELMGLESGAGLAAPQVGRAIRLFITADFAKGTGVPLVFINPEYVLRSAEMEVDFEGCLSFPERPVELPRHKTVTVRALGLDGLPFVIQVEGFWSRCLQHEYDHLEGKTIHPIIATSAE